MATHGRSGVNQKIHRAVVAFDASGDVIILATDSPQIAYDMECLRTCDACEVGLTSPRRVGPGLSLWTGTVEMLPCNHESDSDVESVYTGKLSPILNMIEALKLLGMTPPDPEHECAQEE
jgi:hypothetical protein